MRNCCLLAASVITVSWGMGCASLHREQTSFSDAWDPGVEIRFSGAEASPHEDVEVESMAPPEYEVDVVTAPDRVMPPIRRLVRDMAAVTVFTLDNMGPNLPTRKLAGVPDRGDTKYTLIPGSYAFEYAPERVSPVWGAIHLYPVSTARGKDFIRHTSLNLTPHPEGRRSVLSQEDIDRARSGDVVTKVVLVADLAAVRDRLDKIERGQRELRRLRGTLQDQEEYWARKYNDRKLNTRYGAEFGWGVDVPASDLALLQAIVGPERYHWHRFSEAEDQYRTYQEMIAQLDPPERRLDDEARALRQILNSVTVVHRSDDLVVLTEDMVRNYEDPVHEVVSWRGGEVWADSYRDKLIVEADDIVGPHGKLHLPYQYSSWANGFLSPGLRPLLSPSPALTKNIGQVLLVVQVGSRRPAELEGHSWVGHQH